VQSEHRKPKRKRKSFKSFLKEESESRRLRKRRGGRGRGLPRPSRGQEGGSFSMSIEGEIFEEEQSKEHFTNEVRLAPI
jgi:hypothetical protein